MISDLVIKFAFVYNSTLFEIINDCMQNVRERDYAIWLWWKYVV